MLTHDESARRELLLRLARLPLFAGLDAASLSDLADALNWLTLPGGSILFEQDEDSDALHVLLYGRLAAIRFHDDGSSRVLGSVMPGECVGEVGLITRSPRSASVWALRDCELLRLPRPSFERLIASHPASMLSMARVALRRTHVGIHPPSLPRCFALLPVANGLDTRNFAERLANAFGVDPQTALVDAEQARYRDSGWFTAREKRSSHLIYVGNDDEVWRDRCLRQSDCVLLLGDSAQQPNPASPNPAPEVTPHIPQHLVLLQSSTLLPGRTKAWLEAFSNVTAHYHLRDQADLERLARRLNGKSIGLVLSGGGARGFAHIGVVRALREAGTHIDHVGGASIGAVIGAGVAADWPYEHMVEVYRQCFVDTNPLSDWTLPLISLRAGRKASKLLRQAFGERDIEDLPLPFYAVSSNLTAGALKIHERGALWFALRASSAIPGILPPVFTEEQVLVDGGVIDNLPVGEMRSRLSGDIIAVDVGGNYQLTSTLEETELPAWWRLLPEWFGVRKRPTLAQILLRSGMVNSAATVQRRRKQTKLLLTPTLPGVELLEWREFNRAIELGYQYTLRRLEEER